MKKLQPLILVLMLAVSQLAVADPQELVLIGTDLPIGEIDPFSEGSKDGGLTWGPTYSVGSHPWGNLSGTTGWVNVYPCQGNELTEDNGLGGFGKDVLGNSITNPSTECGIGAGGAGQEKVSWIRIRFYMPTTFSGASMNLNMKADNQGEVFLNDNYLATIQSQTLTNGDFSPAVISQHLNPGLNTLKLKLTDWLSLIHI